MSCKRYPDEQVDQGPHCCDLSCVWPEASPHKTSSLTPEQAARRYLTLLRRSHPSAEVMHVIECLEAEMDAGKG